MARFLALMVCAMVGIAGCGQRGPLYLPDKNARVVTRPAGASAPVANSSAPAAPR
jgi:predicted small lipoprotein YifL